MKKTLTTILHPDGKVDLPAYQKPQHPIKVKLTFLEDGLDDAELGDYLAELENYEEKLARGDIRWK